MTFNEQILELLIQSKKNVKTAVNISMVYTYYEDWKKNSRRRAEWQGQS